MQGEIEMSLMGYLTYFLGFQIKQLKEGTFVCQTKYCQDLLKRFKMVNEKSVDTQIPINGKLDRDENGKDVDVKRYRGMIISFLYLTASRSDIMFSVCVCVLSINPLLRNHI